jgi:signal transduction histidine kinase
VRQVRELSQSISPSLLKEVELEDLLRGMLSQFHNQTSIEVNLFYEGQRSISSNIALTIYRVVEEQLENVHLHAKATQLTIQVSAFDDISVCIQDNGIGVNGRHLKIGSGLHKIKATVEDLKGNVEVATDTKNGCRLTVAIPLSKVPQGQELVSE